MLAIETFDPTLHAIFLLIAVILFVIQALQVFSVRVHLGWLGLAFAFFPAMWNQFVVS